ncbi:hypothetical protein [Thermacetogenium phaeum]|uniref:hypothetical protein n=1 Tax=Thermacetogenium phaeum TaxID=85874 RepID=UPI0012DF5E24|nr:hypothetical protein [Thermacetogenium phaeum]
MIDHHAANGGTNRGTKKGFILVPQRPDGGCYSPLTKEQQTAAESRQDVEIGDSAAGPS